MLASATCSMVSQLLASFGFESFDWLSLALRRVLTEVGTTEKSILLRAYLLMGSVPYLFLLDKTWCCTHTYR
jgi:hypothetical protein